MLGAMPNSNRCIESQLMQRFLRESQALSSSIPDDGEFSEQLRPVLPEIKHTGSIADMMSSTEQKTTEVQIWTLDSLGSSIELPKFSSRCVLDRYHRECVTKLYCSLYSVSQSDIDIAHSCLSYSSVVLNGKMFGTHKSRTAASSVVIANWDFKLTIYQLVTLEVYV